MRQAAHCSWFKVVPVSLIAILNELVERLLPIYTWNVATRG